LGFIRNWGRKFNLFGFGTCPEPPGRRVSSDLILKRGRPSPSRNLARICIEVKSLYFEAIGLTLGCARDCNRIIIIIVINFIAHYFDFLGCDHKLDFLFLQS